MYIVLLVNILATLFAYLSNKGIKWGLKISFFIIFIFLALRYNYGNDYQSYRDGFLYINQYKNVDYINNSLYEIGWVWLCRVFKPLGFEGLIIVLALINCIIYYTFIRKYVPPKYYALAIFVYVFTAGIMLTQLSAMRQGLAIGIFLHSIKYLLDNKYIKYSILIALASLFHTSAIILILLLVIKVFKFKTNILMIVSIYLLFFLLSQNIGALINLFVENYFPQYSYYYNRKAENASGLGFILPLIFLIFSFLYMPDENEKNKELYRLYIVSILLLPFGLSVMMISRFNYYLLPISIAIYPLIANRIKKPILKYFFLSLVIAQTLYGFYSLFNSEIWHNSLFHYHTIFSKN